MDVEKTSMETMQKDLTTEKEVTPTPTQDELVSTPPVETAAVVLEEDEEEGMALMQSALESFKRPNDFQVGDKIQGQVVSIDSQYVFLDIGAKSEASIPKEVLMGDDGELPAIGDMVEAFVIQTGHGGIELGKHLPGGDDALAALEEAFYNQIPVEGVVKARNKGGFDVEIFNKRAFCPISQIELRFCEDPEVHLGQTYSFRITELKEKGRNLVVSRRVLLEEENEQLAEAVREKIEPGAELVGTVSSLKPYGAFVDLGAGVEGLVHVSEISHHRVEDPADVLKSGQQVRVLVQKYEPEKNRISLSMKALEEDPWDASVQAFQEGTITTGKVVRLQPFGAFVELAPGVDGLIHISELSHKRVNHPREVVEVGQEVEVKVIKLDLEARRIGLSMKELDFSGRPAEIEGELREGMQLEVIVDKVENFGVFVRLPKNKRGLIPNGELDTPRNADMSRRYPPEKKLQAIITKIDESGRIRLSERAVAKQKEQSEYQEYVKSTKQAKGDAPVFGTLGDLLQKFQK